MKSPPRVNGPAAALAAALHLLGRRRRDERRKTGELERLGRNLSRNEFEGADLDRRRQARLLRQGTQGDLYRQRRRHSGRYENDLHCDDRLSGSRPAARDRSQAAAPAQGPSQAAATAKGPNQATANPARRAIRASSISTRPGRSPSSPRRRSPLATARSYDKAEDKVWLIGHVTLSDGQNVTKGDKLTYDLKTGQATIDPGAKSGRVHGQFIQNSARRCEAGPTLRRRNRSRSLPIFRRPPSPIRNERPSVSDDALRERVSAPVGWRKWLRGDRESIGSNLMDCVRRTGRSRGASPRQELSRPKGGA